MINNFFILINLPNLQKINHPNSSTNQKLTQTLKDKEKSPIIEKINNKFQYNLSGGETKKTLTECKSVLSFEIWFLEKTFLGIK